MTESLADVSARLLPYWFGDIVPELRDGRRVLVVSHGNAIRVLVKFLDRVPVDALDTIAVPTAAALRYELGSGELGGPGARDLAVD